MKEMFMTPRFIAKSALIAAVYVALTGVFAMASFGFIQFRIADAMIILAFYSLTAVPGLTVGCFIANILWSPFGIADVFFGTLATFIGAALCYALRSNRPLALAPNVIANGILVALVLSWANVNSFPILVFYIAVSQAIVCYAIGLPLSKALDKFADKMAD
jgi:uncharacterized membrane protein